MNTHIRIQFHGTKAGFERLKAIDPEKLSKELGVKVLGIEEVKSDRAPYRGHYYQTYTERFRVDCLGIMEGNAGRFRCPMTEYGDTLEEAKANLNKKIEKECVLDFRIEEWVERSYCPCTSGHHIGSTCGVCGQKG